MYTRNPDLISNRKERKEREESSLCSKENPSFRTKQRREVVRGGLDRGRTLPDTDDGDQADEAEDGRDDEAASPGGGVLEA